MAKQKPGLHKQIQLIFEGVPIPRDERGTDSDSAPAPEGKGHLTTPPVSSFTSIRVSETREPYVPAQPTPESPSPPGGPEAETIAKPEVETRWHKIKDKVFGAKDSISGSRQKVVVLLVPVLLTVLIVLLARNFRFPSRRTNKPSDVASSGQVEKSGNQIEWELPEPYPITLRDPMQFGTVAVERTRASRIIVRGIVFSEDGSTAVIGTSIVREGDEIDEAKIVKINQDSVDFEKDGEKWTQKVER